MVPKLHASGKSFKKLAAYLLHDPEKAKTSERVKWTHTLNMADDHPSLAVDSMLWTARAADELKRAAGIKAGGRPLENPVKHFSLNWHRSQDPTQEQMVEAVESFLAHMKWSEHEVLIVCHDEAGKQPHVHCMVCAVHPETGRALDTSFENARAQTWAREYERQQELVFCDERLKPYAERTPSPTRATWAKLRAYEKEDDQIEGERVSEPLDYFERGGEDGAHAREWRALKDYQRDERIEFFVEGKEAYRQVRNEAYREVRTEFRTEWSCYYDAKRRGMDKDSLTEMKADIIARQDAELDSRRGAACQELRTSRDWDYEQILRRQQEQRAELRDRQQQGLSSYHLIEPPEGREPVVRDYEPLGSALQEDRPGSDRFTAPFRSAANEVCSPDGDNRIVRIERDEHKDFETPVHEPSRVRDPADAVGGIGLGALGALASIGEKLFDGFLGGGGKSEEPRQAPPKHAMAKDDQAAAQRATVSQARNEAEEQEAAKLKAWWDERRKRHHERD